MSSGGAHSHEHHDTRHEGTTRHLDERHGESLGRGRSDRHDVVAREQEEHGGIKWGSAFFGWLTAMGTAVLVTALLGAVGAAVGLASLSGTQQAESQARQNAETVGLVGGIALLVVLFVAYFAGGYVAGRMARFDGVKQGIAVWVWAIVVAILVALLAAVAGSQYDVLSQLNSLPRLPLQEGTLTTGGIVTAVAALAATLGGAVLGGLAGMRFHRKVDRTGLGR